MTYYDFLSIGLICWVFWMAYQCRNLNILLSDTSDMEECYSKCLYKED